MALPTYGPGGIPRRTELGDYMARGGGYSGGGTVTVGTPATGMSSAALAAIQRAKAYYQPGGGFGKGTEAGLERGRIKATSLGMQNLVSAGLAGTTMAGGLGLKFEEEIGAPTRARVEETRAQALSGLEMGQAGMIQSATESSAQRMLQLYLARLRANLQRGPAISQPTFAPRPQQFPSLYGQDQFDAAPRAPSLMGSGEWPTMTPFGGEVYGTQEAFETSLEPQMQGAISTAVQPEQEFGPPTPYYGPGGGWKEWK